MQGTQDIHKDISSSHRFSDERHRYDAVILGTSPILLIEGLLRARGGQRVLFLDANEESGGAWSSTSALGMRSIESACHLIVNYRGVYDFLQDTCGIRSEPVSPLPLVKHRGRFIPFNTRALVLRRMLSLTLGLLLHGSLRILERLLLGLWRCERTHRYDFDRALQNLAKRALIPMVGSAKRRAIQYPVGGSPSMIQNFEDELRNLGADFRKTKADTLQLLENGGAIVTTESGIDLHARNVVTSESASIGTVITPNSSRMFSEKKSTYHTLVLQVSGLKENDLSYTELPFDPIAERVADVTASCEGNLPPGQRILICETPWSKTSIDELPTAEEVLSHLKTQGALPATVSIRKHAYRQLTLRSGERSLIKHLRRIESPSLTVLPSRGDLAYTLHRNQARWKRLSARLASRKRAHSESSAAAPIPLNRSVA